MNFKRKKRKITQPKKSSQKKKGVSDFPSFSFFMCKNMEKFFQLHGFEWKSNTPEHIEKSLNMLHLRQVKTQSKHHVAVDLSAFLPFCLLFTLRCQLFYILLAGILWIVYLNDCEWSLLSCVFGGNTQSTLFAFCNQKGIVQMFSFVKNWLKVVGWWLPVGFVNKNKSPIINWYSNNLRNRVPINQEPH